MQEYRDRKREREGAGKAERQGKKLNGTGSLLHSFCDTLLSEVMN